MKKIDAKLETRDKKSQQSRQKNSNENTNMQKLSDETERWKIEDSHKRMYKQTDKQYAWNFRQT